MTQTWVLLIILALLLAISFSTISVYLNNDPRKIQLSSTERDRPKVWVQTSSTLGPRRGACEGCRKVSPHTVVLVIVTIADFFPRQPSCKATSQVKWPRCTKRGVGWQGTNAHPHLRTSSWVNRYVRDTWFLIRNRQRILFTTGLQNRLLVQDHLINDYVN